MKPLTKVIELVDAGETGGTTIFSDGTKAYWNEGRSSAVVFLDPDGDFREVDVAHLEEDDPYITILDNPGPDDVSRFMTTAEELEWRLARNGFRA